MLLLLLMMRVLEWCWRFVQCNANVLRLSADLVVNLRWLLVGVIELGGRRVGLVLLVLLLLMGVLLLRLQQRRRPHMRARVREGSKVSLQWSLVHGTRRAHEGRLLQLLLVGVRLLHCLLMVQLLLLLLLMHRLIVWERPGTRVRTQRPRRVHGGFASHARHTLKTRG